MSSNLDHDGNSVQYDEQETKEEEEVPPASSSPSIKPHTDAELMEDVLDDFDAIPPLAIANVEQLQEMEINGKQQNLDHDEISGHLSAVSDAGDTTPKQMAVKLPGSPSVDDSASIPDDTPSVRGSILSSPQSETPPPLVTPIRDRSPSSPHRPFDRRFQSRLSSYGPLASRDRSPAFLTLHSRQSSMQSIGVAASELDETSVPWDVIRWSKLRRLTGQAFSETGKRNFGTPTCLAVTDNVVVGTSRGMILIFDHQQTNKAVIGAGTKAVESGAVIAIAISADHTTIASGHASGHIFTWEVSRPARPFLHIPPIDLSHPQGRKSDGHVTGSAVVHLNFLGYRHTALVSADDRGMAFSHLATRGFGAVGRVVKTARILGRYPDVIARSTKPLKKSSVLAFSSLPLGNIDQRTDSIGLVAMMTPYLLVIVSTTPVAQTQHKAARAKDVTAHGAMTAALAWFPAIKLRGKSAEVSRTKLAYAWSDVLTVLEVHEVLSDAEEDVNKPPELQFFPRSSYRAEESIVAVQWLSRSVMAVLTLTQQLLIIEDITMEVTDSFDLMQKNIYHTDLFSHQLETVVESLDEQADTTMHGVVADAFHMGFRSYKGRLFLLGFVDVWWGTLTNWADRLLALMNVGDFIGALRLATKYHAGRGEKATIGLPEDDTTRSEVVKEKILEMMSASLRYVFGKNQQAGPQEIDVERLSDLAEACIAACLTIRDQDFLFDEVFEWFYDHGRGSLFVDILEPYILDGQVISLPPLAVKILIDHFAQTHSPSKLEEIICLLDTTTMDIDQVTTLCKQHNLYDAYIYVWTKALADFESPLNHLLQIEETQAQENGYQRTANKRLENAQKIFPYISYVLTGRVYPTGVSMDDDMAAMAKAQIYEFLFSGKPETPTLMNNTNNRSVSLANSFANLHRILSFDTPNFISALNEAFEDSFLNTADDNDSIATGDTRNSVAVRRSYNRQYLVRILLEVMSSDFPQQDTIYLDMFIARNLPKYPQYLLLSGTTLQDIFSRLCRYPDPTMRDDAQLSAEYLLSVYRPPDILNQVTLIKEAKFYRILKSVFRQEAQYSNLIETYFVDPSDQSEVFGALVDILRHNHELPTRDRNAVLDIVRKHSLDLVQIDLKRTARTIDSAADELHLDFLHDMDDDLYAQYRYLEALFETRDSFIERKVRPIAMQEQYVRLLCQYNRTHVADYVESMKEGDLRLDQVLPAMEQSHIVDAAVILQARQGQVKEAMERLTKHFSALQVALQGILHSAVDSPDEVATNEAIEDLLQSIDKYARVGIWLCQGQTKIAAKSKSVSKSPRRSSTTQQPLCFEEVLWLDLLHAIVLIARNTSPSTLDNTPSPDGLGSDSVSNSLRTVIQEVFTALLTSTTSVRDHSGARDLMFLRILQAFLTRAAGESTSLSELRSVITSIFSAYAHEEALLSLSNSMLDKDVFVYIDEITRLRRQGWRPRGQVCEVCRRRVWGLSSGESIWDIWQQNEEIRRDRYRRAEEVIPQSETDIGRGKGKATAPPPAEGQQTVSVILEPIEATVGEPEKVDAVVVFSCRHIYHRRCLESGGPLTNSAGEVELVPEQPRLACPACA